MTAIIALLQAEHRNIEKLLRLLEQELRVFNSGERPEYELLLAVISYFQDYPDRCHHPKEDMIYAALKLRDPSVAAAVADIETEHRGEAGRLRRFTRIAECIQADQDVLRAAFHGAVRDFVDYQRRHIEKEERLLFPAAIKTLQSQDWADIEARRWDRSDPLFNSAIEEQFALLHRRLVEWQEETEAERSHSQSPGASSARE
jgi:hemerythrin-like domain-containing protein